MKLTQRRSIHALIAILTVLSMLLTPIAPIIGVAVAQAQESTPDPQPPVEVTAEATEAPLPEAPPPTEATDAPQAPTEPPLEVTSEATSPVAVPSEESTEEATIEPTPAPVLGAFYEDFQDGVADGFSGEGWQVVTENDNAVLRFGAPAQTAAVANLSWEHLRLTLRTRLGGSDVINIAVRAGAESYLISVRADGHTSLYRSGVLLAESTVFSLDETPEATAEPLPPLMWRMIAVEALGGAITVLVDGFPQFTYTDPVPLGSGAISFSSGPDNVGVVDIDDINATELPAPVLTTPQPEVTAEATSESTPAPVIEATAEATAEATEIPSEAEEVHEPLLTTDFSGDLAAWLFDAESSVVDLGEGNFALSLAPNNTLRPAEPLYMADVEVAARFNITSDAADETPNGFSLIFRAQESSAYILSIESTQTALYREDGSGPVLLTSVPAARELNTWYTLALTTSGNVITVSVDGIVELEFTDEIDPLVMGQVVFKANNASTVLLDDITLDDAAGAQTATVATPLISAIDELYRDKIDETLFTVVNTYAAGDEAAALALAEENSILIAEETLFVSVIVSPAADYTVTAVSELITATGGVVEGEYDSGVYAQVSLMSFAALLSTNEVGFIRQQMVLHSTSAADMPLTAPLTAPRAAVGNPLSEGFDIVGANPWHDAGVLGAGVVVSVIDRGGAHTTNVVEVVRDIAPSATVRTCIAATNVALANCINTERAAGANVMLITIDMGANVSPGDGTGASDHEPAAADVYSNINTARAAGVVVIASAGNSDNRYVSVNGAGTVEMNLNAGDVVNVRWEGAAPSLSGLGTATGTGNGRRFNSPGTGTRTLTIGGGSGVVQVQILGTGTITGGGTFLTTTGSMARPADSQNVIAVGSVCSRYDLNYDIVENTFNSSRGPNFGPGGSDPGAVVLTGANVKPEVVAPSGVSVPNLPIADPSDPCDTTRGFTGSSAAAAHVAGMVALLISSPNPAFDAFNNGAPNRAAAVEGYLMMNTNELPFGIDADGFDPKFGAGLTVLGDPQTTIVYNQEGGFAASIGQLADSTCSGDIYYVGKSDPLSLVEGTIEEPFVHPGQAIAQASAGDCIVLLPGIYHDTLLIDNQFPADLTIRSYAPTRAETPTIFWVTNSVKDPNENYGSAVLFVQDNNPVFDGFIFKATNPFGDQNVSALRVAVFDTATSGAMLANSVITGFDDPNNNETLIRVVDNSQGVFIEGNTFENNAPEALLPLIDITESGLTTPITVQYNIFTNNTPVTIGANVESESLINIGGTNYAFPVDARANIYSNQFGSNVAEAIINVNVPLASTYEIQIASNVFVNNRAIKAIVHLNPGPNIRFVNNTVANNDLNDNTNYGGVVIRGINPADVGGPDVNGAGSYEVHNNLLYNNRFAAGGGFISNVAGNPGCPAIDGGAPVRFNYVYNQSIYGVAQIGGDCAAEFNNPANGNRSETLNGLVVLPDRDFVGPNTNPALSDTNPLYYQIYKNNNDVCATGNSIFENAGDNAEILAMPAVTLDAKRTGRIVPPISSSCPSSVERVDIGGFEVSVLQGYPLNVTVVEDSGEGANGNIYRINLIAGEGEGVDGGFAPYSFQLLSTPLYTGSSSTCGAGFSQGMRIVGSDVLYCAPRDFHNQGVSAPVSFEVRARDASQTQVEFTVTVTIQPRDDRPIQTTIGNQPTPPQLYEIVAAVNGTATFRLRPYVRFDNNFFFSERNNMQDGGTTVAREVDYPFTYSNSTIVVTGADGENTSLFTEGQLDAAFAAVGPDGLITIPIAPSETGFLEFTYRVDDSNLSNPGAFSTNRVRIRVVELIPQEGLHDDTSLSFNYYGTGGLATPGGWTALYSEGNINNTLHQTTTQGDTAEFTFVGTGFILYMQGNSRGSNYELLVDGVPYNGECFEFRTTAPILGGGLLSNLNRLNRVYTVSCNGLEETQHTITIINRARTTLAIDAVGILRGDAVVPKGFHDVDDLAVFPLFGNGWTETLEATASNGIVMTTTSPTAEPIEFSFRGSGVAIGTMLQAALNPVTRKYDLGAQYTICIDPEGSAPEVCQTFDNSIGATSRPIVNVFRPFMGYDPTGTHRVTILVNSIPAGTRFAIDSIVVFGEEHLPVATLPLGTTQDDARGLMIFGNGIDDSWATDTLSRLVPSGSLTSQARGIIGAGPFVTFEIPGAANAFYWGRYANVRSDSQNVLICVDRAKGVSNSCQEFDLRTAPNPLPVLESGSSWGAATTHTVEIFSLTNSPFTMDFVQVLNTASPLLAGIYEHDTLGAITQVGSFAQADLVNRSFSAGSALQTYTSGDAVLFRFTGTGFQPRFLLDRYGGNVEICWAKGTLADVAAVDAAVAANNGACVTVNNNSSAANYVGYRTIAGLENTTHTAYIQHVGTNYNPATRTGNIMVLDTITVLNEDWSTLNVLDQTDVRYETSYTNSLTENNFLYYGAGWRSFTGTRYTTYSGLNYDQITRVNGAGIVFRTDNADIVRLYRDTRNGYAKLLACSAPYSGATVNYGSFECAVILNNGGTGTQQIYNIPLSGSGPHIVSIMTLDNTTFNLDAIELVNSVPALAPGQYLETHPGLTYGYDVAPTNEATVWRNTPLASRHVNDTAMESTAPGARLTFSCDNCTGFTLLTMLDRNSGTLTVTAAGGSVNITNYQMSAYDAAAIYGTAGGRLSLVNLPVGDYTFTITETDPTKNKFVVDGLIIYGNDVTQPLAPNLYDDHAKTPDGTPLFVFGPTITDWTLAEGRSAPTALFQTTHSTVNYGELVRFRVDDADAITLYFNARSTTTALRVCAVPTTGAVNDTTNRCTTLNISANFVAQRIYTATLDDELFPTKGDYFVSITNLSNRRPFQLDAVGVHDLSDAVLEPGIYHSNHPQVTANFGGFTNLALAAATDGFVAVGQTLTFQFEGRGFSILLVEGPTRSTSYTLNTGSGAVPLTSSGNTRDGLVAITRVGFGGGTHTITLTNTSPNPLHIDRIDILGAPSAPIPGNTVGVIENNDPRITYFPYSSFGLVAAAAASGGSQHTTTIPGALAYFEVANFNGTIQYGRQTLSTYASAEICYGNTTDNSACNTPDQTAPNNAPHALYKQVFTTNAIGGGTNNYVAFENAGPTTGLIMPVDFFRLTNPNQVLTAGEYDDTFAVPANTNNLAFTPGAFTDTTLASAFGGSIKVANEAGSALVGVFEGSGFSVLFTLDRQAGPVEICWASSDLYSGNVAAAIAAVGTANCQTFDNNSTATRTQAMRTIVGLDFGIYTFFVRHTGTSYDPVTRTGNTMQVDGIRVYGDDVQTALTQLTPANGRIETNYASRLADNQFLYYGNLWSHFTGTRYRTYSGMNYDQSRNEIGASVVFRTNGANSLLIYRDIRSGYAPMLVCAAPESDLSNQFCTLVNNALGTGVQQAVSVRLNAGGSTAPHVVSITTMSFGLLNLDAVELVNASGPLVEGKYEDVDPRLTFTGDWTYLYNRVYSDGRTRESRSGDPTSSGAGDTLTFSFTGTGFAIGTEQSLFVGEMEICYGTDATWGNGDDHCYIYQNESRVVSYTTLRTVTGLTAGTYFVRVRNAEDGANNVLYNPARPRAGSYAPGRMRIDFVQVLNDPLPPVVAEPGFYNELDTDDSGVPLLQLQPTGRWASFVGARLARGYSFLSFVTPVDASARASRTDTGPTATMRVQIPANTSATVILYTGTASTTNATQVLICANSVDQSSCVVSTAITTQNQIVVDSSALAALNNTTGGAVTVTLSVRALTTGFFRIDGFQIIHGTRLTAGIYDSFLIGSVLPTAGGTWTTVKNASTFNGTYVQSPTLGATVSFSFNGTGISVVLLRDRVSAEMRVCYKLSSLGTAFPARSEAPAAGITCNIVPPEARSTFYQYGYTIYGLPNGNYDVQIMVHNQAAASYPLKIDAIAVFGDASVAPALTSGQIYDDTADEIIYAPEVFWTESVLASGPPRGPWNKTETTATVAGAVVQLNIDGNGMILYQTADSRSSMNARMCLVAENETPGVNENENVVCTEFSQNSRAVRYFTPILFYGFGSGDHVVILENRDHGRTFRIDGIQIID